MPLTYPPAPGTYNNSTSVYASSRFLAQPNWVAHRLATLLEQRYVGLDLLKGRQETSGGAVGYETIEGIFADSPPANVAPGAEYTMTTIQQGPAGLTRVVKSGQDTLVTAEEIKRAAPNSIQPAEKAMLKLVNSQGAAVDGSVVSLIASAVTDTQPAFAVWTGSSAAILRDIQLAKAKVTKRQLGYVPNVLLVDDVTEAYLSSDPTIAAAMAREDKTNPIYTGKYNVIAGLEIVTTAALNIPNASVNGSGNATSAWVLDTNQLGFIATEDLNLDGEYQQAGEIMQSRSWKTDNDAWRLRVRSNFAPVVTDAGAGCRITGVAA